MLVSAALVLLVIMLACGMAIGGPLDVTSLFARRLLSESLPDNGRRCGGVCRGNPTTLAFPNSGANYKFATLTGERRG
jgi:hypothetical protein